MPDTRKKMNECPHSEKMCAQCEGVLERDPELRRTVDSTLAIYNKYHALNNQPDPEKAFRAANGVHAQCAINIRSCPVCQAPIGAFCTGSSEYDDLRRTHVARMWAR